MTEPAALHTSFRDLADVFFRRLWPMVAIFTLIVGSATAWRFLIQDDVYEVTAKLLVKFVTEQSTQATMTGQRNQVVGYRQQDVNSEVAILKSLDLVSRVVDKHGLDKRSPPPIPEGLWRRMRYEAKKFVSTVLDWIDELLVNAGLRPRLSDRDKAIATLDRSLTVTSESDSNIIVVKLRMPSRDQAAGVLNAIVAMYLESRYRLFEDAGATDVFAKQVREVHERLDSAERRMRQLQLGTSLVAITARKEILLRRAFETRASLSEATVRLSESEGKLDRLRAQLRSASPNIGVVGSFNADTVEDSLVRRMAELRREEEQLAMTEFDNNMRLQNIRNQFHALAAIMLANLEATEVDRRTAVESREKELSKIESELATIGAHEFEWVTLNREIGILAQRNEFYQKKYEDAEAALALERARIGNVAVVQSAQEPLRPVGVSRSAFVLIVALLGALAALSWCAVAEFLDDRVRSVDEVERWLGAPVLATVPLNQGSVQLATVAADPAAEHAEISLRKAAIGLHKALTQSGAKTVAFSGTGTGAGSTSMALQMARHMRFIYDSKVVVVELDTPVASLCELLDLDSQRTLQAYVRGEYALIDCVQNGPAGISVLASGRDPLVSGTPAFTRIAELLGELEKSFDHVLLDMPPLPERPEILAIGHVVSQALIVVESARARIEVLQRMRTELAHEGITLVGAILNKQRRPIPSWAYRAFFE